jgi:hypothetical protein
MNNENAAPGSDEFIRHYLAIFRGRAKKTKIVVAFFAFLAFFAPTFLNPLLWKTFPL